MSTVQDVRGAFMLALEVETSTPRKIAARLVTGAARESATPLAIVEGMAGALRGEHARLVNEARAAAGSCPVCNAGEHGTTHTTPHRVAGTAGLDDFTAEGRAAREQAIARVVAGPLVGLIEHPGANRWGSGDDWRANDPSWSVCQGPKGQGCAGLAPAPAVAPDVAALLEHASTLDDVAAEVRAFNRCTRPVKGSTVEVVRGRRVPLGTIGIVAVLNERAGDRSRYAPAFMVPETVTRVGIRVEGVAELAWTDGKNVRVMLDPVEERARREAADALEVAQRVVADAAKARASEQVNAELSVAGIATGTRVMLNGQVMVVFWTGMGKGANAGPRVGLRPAGADRRASATWMDLAAVAKLERLAKGQRAPKVAR